MPSKAANWSLRVAVFAPILAVMSVIAHRMAIIDTAGFIVLLFIVMAIAVLALTLVFFAFRSLWVHGKRGGRRATWALFFAALVLAPAAFGLARWTTLPQVIEVSTDRIDPPAFRAELLEFGARAPTMIAATLTDAYPELTSRRYNATSEIVYDLALETADNSGWDLEMRRGRIGVDPDLIAEFTRQSAILGMPHRIIVRVREEDETTVLDIRSAALFGTHDLGSNARLVGRYVAAMDFGLIGRAQ